MSLLTKKAPEGKPPAAETKKQTAKKSTKKVTKKKNDGGKSLSEKKSDIAKDIQETKRKGIKITGKILALLFGVILAMVVTILIVVSVQVRNNSQMFVENWLKSTSYAVSNYYNSTSSSDYTYDGNELRKGSFVVSEHNDFIDSLREDLDVYTALFYGKEACISSVISENGERDFSMEVTVAINNAMATGEGYFTDGYEISGVEYYGYFTPINNNAGAIIGIMFCGVKDEIVSEQISEAVGTIFIFIGIIAAIALAIAFVAVGRVVKSIKYSVNNINKLAQGELNMKVTKRMKMRSDEAGDMARSVQKVINSLKEIVEKIIKASTSMTVFTQEFTELYGNMSGTIDNVNIAVDEIANGASSQANETQHANGEVLNMGNAIGEATVNVDVLGKSSTAMKTYSDKASDTLSELIRISEETKKSVDEVQKQTNLTNKSAIDIQAATELIAGIASQTNLLSLNASIEAARAGENGRGFAVVANEIRNLADQSKVSAERIANIVNTLIENSNISVKTMNEVMNDIGEQNVKLEDTRNMFDSLNSEIIEVTGAVEEIKNEMAQLNEMKEIVLSSVEAVAAIAEENAASTEETAASMQELTTIVDKCSESTKQLVSLSNDLEDSIKVFTL